MTKQKIGKGKPLEELVKGSYDYTLHTIRQAFYRAFPDNYDESEIYWVVEAFADYLIVNAYGLPADEFWRVNYTRNRDGSYSFTPRDEWELVELTYQPATRPVSESKGQDGQPRKFVEQIRASMELTEAAKTADNSTGPWRVKGYGVTADIVNYNNHRYPGYAISRAVREAQQRLKAEPGRLVISGEVDHPSDKGNEAALLGQTTYMWDKIEFKGGKVLIEGVMFGTQEGRDMYARMQGGLKPDLSQRAWGQSILVEDEDGTTVEEIVEFSIAGYDAVTEGADPYAGVEQIESNKSNKNGGQPTMSDKTEKVEDADATISKAEMNRQKVLKQGLDTLFGTLLASRSAEVQVKVRQYVESQNPQDLDDARRLINERLSEYDAIAAEARQREAQLRQQLGLSETDDLTTVLAQREAERQQLQLNEQRRAVQEFVDRELGSVTYPAHIKEAFIKAVKADEPGTVEEAKTVIAKHKVIYSELAAKHKQQLIGLGVQVIGPTIEESGYPQFALAAHAINEALAKRGQGRMHGYMNQPIERLSINQLHARAYLELFDRQYGHVLIEEARRFEEAEGTTDLNLPYSVMRAIVPEVWANLVAGSIFNFGIASQDPERIYYEEYTGETGETVAITNEDFNSGAFAADANGLTMGPWVQLAHKGIIPGTVVVNIDGGGALITDDGTNYVVDYMHGRIRMIDGGSSNANVTASTAYEIDYQYRAIAEGEGAEIERAKLKTTYKTLEAAAKRLATEITQEAIVFSRSQLQMDAVTRTLVALVNQVRNDVDKNIFFMALSAALQVANNIAGTWNSSTGTPEELIKLIGYAKVKVEKRHYEANAIIASTDIANRISDADQFSSAGQRADGTLAPAGYVVDVKGLPLFRTNNFSDSYLLVVNTDLVMHRIFRAMMAKGPFPTYGTNRKLIASDQYYVEEFNGTDTPVVEKASVVKIS